MTDTQTEKMYRYINCIPLVDTDAIEVARTVYYALSFIRRTVQIQATINAYCEVAFSFRPFK